MLKIINRFLQIFTSLLLGLTLSLILQEVMGFGTLAFVFVMLVGALLVFRLLRTWTIFSNLVFLFICILVGMLLRMYVMLAP
jgi:uncharacterized membrane protein YeaQ/YmgE (transglycosylase-associated protein family)